MVGDEAAAAALIPVGELAASLATATELIKNNQ